MNVQQNIILYDGVCGLCNGLVQFLLPRDKEGKYVFASLQSTVGIEIQKKYHLNPDDLSSVIFIEKGNMFQKSTAGIKILAGLGGFWRLCSILGYLPKGLRDFFYDIIAKNRYKWFGKHDSCMMMLPEYKSRFLD